MYNLIEYRRDRFSHEDVVELHDENRKETQKPALSGPIKPMATTERGEAFTTFIFEHVTFSTMESIVVNCVSATTSLVARNHDIEITDQVRHKTVVQPQLLA